MPGDKQSMKRIDCFQEKEGCATGIKGLIRHKEVISRGRSSHAVSAANGVCPRGKEFNYDYKNNPPPRPQQLPQRWCKTGQLTPHY